MDLRSTVGRRTVRPLVPQELAAPFLIDAASSSIRLFETRIAKGKTRPRPLASASRSGKIDWWRALTPDHGNTGLVRSKAGAQRPISHRADPFSPPAPSCKIPDPQDSRPGSLTPAAGIPQDVVLQDLTLNTDPQHDPHKRAEGPYLFDSDGCKYLDWVI